MTKTRCVAVVLSIVAGVLAGVALASSGDGAGMPVVHEKTCCVVGDADGPMVVDIRGLADGESCTTKADDKQIVATRKGNAVEVAVVDKDGNRSVLIGPSDSTCGNLLGDLPSDGKPRQLVIRIGKDGACNTTAMLAGGAEDGAKVTCLRSEVDKDGQPGGVTTVTSHACVIANEAATVTYGCKEDGATVSIPADKAPQQSPLCPVCNKEMARVVKHRVIIQTTI
jgi:hypothetical protein